MKKVICDKCGHDKWIMEKTCFKFLTPSIMIQNYKCEKCGNIYRKIIKENQAITLYEDEQ